VGSCPHSQADDVIAELCEHLYPSVAVGRRAGFSLESLAFAGLGRADSRNLNQDTTFGKW